MAEITMTITVKTTTTMMIVRAMAEIGMMMVM
jgi:hypothetical protein